MTEYRIFGTTELFETNHDFFKEVRNQAFGKREISFCNEKYPSSYFNFTWSGGYLVLNFYNEKTHREAHIETQKKTLSYSLFTELLERTILYYLSIVHEKTFCQWLWLIIKWFFRTLSRLLGAILKGLWSLTKWLITA